MKLFFKIFLLCSLSTTFLFSCAEIENIEKRTLSYPELEAVLNNSPSFQLYINAIRKAENEITTKAKNITKSDKKWIHDIFDQFPTLEVFLANNAQSSIDKFIRISGIEIQEENEELTFHYSAFTKALYQNYSFEEKELSQLILTHAGSKVDWSKNSSSSCETYCTNGANEEFNRVENECKEENGTYCRARALMAQRYYKRGCMRGCRYE